MSIGRVGSLPNKSKKKKKEEKVASRRKEKEKQSNMEKPCTWAFLSKNDVQFFPSIFSPFWRENVLVGQGEKHLDPTIYFPFSPPNQTHSKKFYFPFSLQSFLSTLFHLRTNTPLLVIWSQILFLDPQNSFKILNILIFGCK